MRGAQQSTGNVISFDVEDWYHCLEPDPTKWDRFEDRVEAATHRLLDLMDETDTRATFFVLGHVAERHPDLVRRIDRA
ncbi:MAG: polysaccharide deacetylase family protein, partial [Gemmatimonadetes bacterium]|nr:polysaccharide deacetylase family protein [Gemmatimonadota bacterium]